MNKHALLDQVEPVKSPAWRAIDTGIKTMITRSARPSELVEAAKDGIKSRNQVDNHLIFE